MNRPTLLVLLGALLLGCAACSDDASTPPLFTRLSPERTGVTFSNTLTESPSLNILNYLYYYNGGGVAVGDLNGDRLPDLYFTANEGPNKLYLNQGDFQFKDVTEAAGVAGSADWSTGVTMADVNGDGRLDIYVSVVYGIQGLKGHNELYINEGPGDSGIPQFTESAAQYGLDQRAYGNAHRCAARCRHQRTRARPASRARAWGCFGAISSPRSGKDVRLRARERALCRALARGRPPLSPLRPRHWSSRSPRAWLRVLRGRERRTVPRRTPPGEGRTLRMR